MATIAEVWYQEGKQEGEREGRREGRQEGKLEIARAMLAKGMEMGLVSEITGLKKEQITPKSEHNGSQ